MSTFLLIFALFCDIIKGDIPSHRIYEDEYTYAFLDISDDCVGHTLVVPKKHYENMLDVDGNTLNHVMDTVTKLSRHYVDNCGFTGVNILNNSGVDALQSVMHLHVHIMPRKANDGVVMYSLKEKMNSDLAEVCEQLKLN